MASRLQFQSSLVELPSADEGNQITLHLRTKIHRSMSGEFWAYKSSPIRQSLSMTFSHLNRPKVVQVRDFLVASRGREVTYVDHANRVWLGKIRTSAHDFVHAAIRNSSASLEMEVTLGQAR